MSSVAPNKEALLKGYLSTAQVLITDQNSSARVGLKKLMVSLGVPINQIFLAASIAEAEELIKDKKPNLVFCDYQIGGKFGLDLLQKQREEHPTETNQCIFFLVTANTSQSAVAQAAEEDIDAYILKPYTLDGFVSSLFRAIQIKVAPPEYLTLINQGKDLLEKDQLDEAMSVFRSALTKDSKPSLACYYEGLTNFKKTLLDGSQNSYKKGLTFNKIHYKCLVGLFDLLMSMEKLDAAYEIVQRIIRFFPANPKRLSAVLRLAIQTGHYEDIETFYQEFLKIDERNDDMVKCVCAALLVCGKHFLNAKDIENGVDLIQKASVSAGGRPFLLKKAIEALTQYDQWEEARSVFKRFTNPSQDEPNYRVASFLLSSKNAKSEALAIQGQELIKSGLKEFEVYRITINSLEKLGKNDRAEDLRLEGQKLFPELMHEIRKAA